MISNNVAKACCLLLQYINNHERWPLVLQLKTQIQDEAPEDVQDLRFVIKITLPCPP